MKRASYIKQMRSYRWDKLLYEYMVYMCVVVCTTRLSRYRQDFLFMCYSRAHISTHIHTHTLPHTHTVSCLLAFCANSVRMWSLFGTGTHNQKQNSFYLYDKKKNRRKQNISDGFTVVMIGHGLSTNYTLYERTSSQRTVAASSNSKHTQTEK